MQKTAHYPATYPAESYAANVNMKPQDDNRWTITAEEALQAEQARYAAQVNRDFDALERLFGDDLVYIHSSTVEDTKTSVIESIRSGRVRYHSIECGEVKVRTYGSIAIVSGSINVEVNAGGEEMSLKMMFHAVWEKRTAGVQFVSWQATQTPRKQ